MGNGAAKKMLKLYFLLFYEFSKIGVFAVGGGYATIPFLFFLQEKYNWFSVHELTNMIAISNITPGPVGINMATYTGFKVAGLTGSIISTSSIVLLPFLITILITKLFTKFQNNKTVNNIFIGLRPAACALLASIAISLLFNDLNITRTDLLTKIDYHQLILFLVLLLTLFFFKKNPLITIILGGIGGIIFNYLI